MVGVQEGIKLTTLCRACSCSKALSFLEAKYLVQKKTTHLCFGKPRDNNLNHNEEYSNKSLSGDK